MFRKLHTITIDRVKEGAVVEMIMISNNAKIVDFRTNGNEETYIVKVSDKNWSKIQKQIAIVRA